MRQAVIENGVVTNICIGDAGGVHIPDDSPIAIGWIYDGLNFSAPPKPKRTVSEMWNLISAHRDKLTTTGGYKVNVAGTDKWFHSDTFSRTQQLGLVLMGASIPANLQWKTMDKTFVTMTQALAAQLFAAAAAASDQAIFAAAEAHRLAMEASADPDAYNFSTGWPVVFLPS